MGGNYGIRLLPRRIVYTRIHGAAQKAHADLSRLGRDCIVRHHKIDKCVWRSRSVVRTADILVHVPLISKHKQVPAVAVVLTHDTWTITSVPGLFGKTTFRLGPKSHCVWQSAAVLLRDAHLCAARPGPGCRSSNRIFGVDHDLQHMGNAITGTGGVWL